MVDAVTEFRGTERRVEQVEERGLHVAGRGDAAGLERAVGGLHFQTRAGGRAGGDARHGSVGHDFATHRLQRAGESLGERAGTALGAPRAVLVDHCLPADKVAGGNFVRRRAGLRRQPTEGGAHGLALEGFFDEATVAGHQLAGGVEAAPELARTGFEEVALEDRAKNPPRSRRFEKGLEDAFVDLAESGDEVAVGHGVTRRDGGDAGAGFFHVPVEADPPRPTRQRVERPRVHFDVLQAVGREVEFPHDRRAAEHDVRAAADIEPVAGHDLFRTYRAADDGATFEDQHAMTGFREVAGANEPVVAGTNDDAIVNSGHGGRSGKRNEKEAQRACERCTPPLLCLSRLFAVVRCAMLTKEFFERHPLTCATELIGCRLVWGHASGMIVETEAYAATGDEACHTFLRRGAQRFVETNPAGTAYIYLNYGIHWLVNVLTKGDGTEGFVLIRALQPRTGLEQMRERRKLEDVKQLCSGPGKLTQALGIPATFHGSSLCRDPHQAFYAAEPVEPKPSIVQDVRIGISRAADLPWRYLLAGSRFVSRAPTKQATPLRNLVLPAA